MEEEAVSITYAIADLHGRYDLLDFALGRIEARDYDLGKPGGKVIFLGDYVDRGFESRKIIERLMKGPDADSGFEWVCLQGNHENIMLTSILAPGYLKWWLGNGGGATLISYGAENGGDAAAALDLIPKEHVEWLMNLPLIHIDEHRIFVHAGVDPFRPLDQQTVKDMQWKLYADDDFRGHDKRHVVHGHHQFENGPLLYDGRTDLDTLAWWTGRAVIGVFNDDVPGGPVEVLEVQGPTIHEWMAKRKAA